ncbi:MAG: transcriptional regulator NrdR [Gammaproteobacteria bacterium]|nr:transcriptional regulator NrdR [Gammaproteobacteria bacterium]MDD9821908.1 transcriptional regulator NrdR [Gammaproteobacteria bacterium]MDD9855249.1 transcriptional regulator NrdR [Gammaproteobacteria bacterium]
MQCPYCAHPDTRVIDSRLGDGGECVRRRRECAACAERFSTFEQTVLSMPQVIKFDGRREKFDESKLRRGIDRALEKRPVSGETVEGAIKRVMRRFTCAGEREVPAAAIGEAVMRELSELDGVAYLRFASVYRRFQDVDAFNTEVERLRGAQLSRPNKVQLSIFGGAKV